MKLNEKEQLHREMEHVVTCGGGGALLDESRWENSEKLPSVPIPVEAEYI